MDTFLIDFMLIHTFLTDLNKLKQQLYDKSCIRCNRQNCVLTTNQKSIHHFSCHLNWTTNEFNSMKINVIEIIKIGAEINRVRQSILWGAFYHNTLHRLQNGQKTKTNRKSNWLFRVFVFKVQIDVNVHFSWVILIVFCVRQITNEIDLI